MRTHDPPKMLTVAEVAQRLDCCEHTVRRMIKEGMIDPQYVIAISRSDKRIHPSYFDRGDVSPINMTAFPAPSVSTEAIEAAVERAVQRALRRMVLGREPADDQTGRVA